MVEFAGASLVSPATVNANQPATGLLATLEFTAGNFGSTTPTLTQHVLLVTGETLGSLLFTESGTTLNVVPEPATGALVAFGLAALALRRRSSQT